MHKRFFGMKKPQPQATTEPVAPPPSLSEASDSLNAKVENLTNQITLIEKELTEIASKTPNLKGYAATSTKQRALMLLKKKKMLQQHRDTLMTSQYNVTQAEMAGETLNTTLLTVQALTHGAEKLKQEYKELDPDKFADIHDDLEDLQYQSEEFNQIFESMATPNLDAQRELEAEFAELFPTSVPNTKNKSSTSKLTDPVTLPKYFPDLPAVPNHPVGSMNNKLLNR